MTAPIEAHLRTLRAGGTVALEARARTMLAETILASVFAACGVLMLIAAAQHDGGAVGIVAGVILGLVLIGLGVGVAWILVRLKRRPHRLVLTPAGFWVEQRRGVQGRVVDRWEFGHVPWPQVRAFSPSPVVLPYLTRRRVIVHRLRGDPTDIHLPPVYGNARKLARLLNAAHREFGRSAR